MEKYQEKVAYYLNEFQKYEKKYGNGIPYSITINKGKHSGHIIFSSLVHGNEVGSLPGILKCIDDVITNKITGTPLTFSFRRGNSWKVGSNNENHNTKQVMLYYVWVARPEVASNAQQ